MGDLTTKSTIKGFFSSYFNGYDLQDDDDIFAVGFVNSLLAMQLVVFIEKEFDITIENEDLDFENFKSVNAIAGLIETKAANVG
ncbi:MAG: phosphopantetheine-binding protein [Nitrososphaera sp.]|nr:phosphopantetheine-binding protein [Nitrososphaera sp.]